MFSGNSDGRELNTHEVIVTVGTVLVALVELRGIFPEGFLALLTDECHLGRLREPVRLRFRVAFGAIEPLLAAGRADGNLGIQNVLATVFQCQQVERDRWMSYHILSVRDRLQERAGFSRLQRLALHARKFTQTKYETILES